MGVLEPSSQGKFGSFGNTSEPKSNQEILANQNDLFYFWPRSSKLPQVLKCLRKTNRGSKELHISTFLLFYIHNTHFRLLRN